MDEQKFAKVKKYFLDAIAFEKANPPTDDNPHTADIILWTLQDYFNNEVMDGTFANFMDLLQQDAKEYHYSILWLLAQHDKFLFNTHERYYVVLGENYERKYKLYSAENLEDVFTILGGENFLDELCKTIVEKKKTFDNGELWNILHTI